MKRHPLERIVSWLPGWYATRLHAIPAESKRPEGYAPAQALCGAWVYSKPVTAWAQRRVDKGIPHCKRCEKLIAS
jgi:hypothetical protein